MAPTICSGKKCPTHTIASTNIRRRRQEPLHLNQTLSNIVNFVAKDPMNPRISTSLKVRTQRQTERDTNSSSSTSCRQNISFITDNAVTSSTDSDTENSVDLRLVSRNLTNESTPIDSSDTTSPSSEGASLSLSSLSEATSSSSHKEKTSPPTRQRQEKRVFQRYSTVMQANKLTVNGEEVASDTEGTGSFDSDNNNKFNSNRKTNTITHSSNIRKHSISCIHFDFADDEELENRRELNSDLSSAGSDADIDIDTDESESMTSFYMGKNAKIKSGNHPLLRDKLLAEQQTNNNNTRSTDGLLSIAIKTIKLVKRNQLLQQRLTQLQLETSEFIQSVLSNPENRHFCENVNQKVQEVNNV